MTFASWLLLVGCADDEPITLDPAHFDGPSGVAILDPSRGGPYSGVVGFVSSSRSGRIHAFDAEHGWLLSDDLSSPFVTAEGIGLGQRRQLGELAVVAPSDDTVTLFVADGFTRTLVEAPFVVGVSGNAPEGPQPVAGDPVFTDVDGSGDSAEIDGVHVQPAAATETWTLSFDGEAWDVEGSRSGRQALQARPTLPFRSDDGTVELTVFGTATAGDLLEFAVDGGVVEHDLGGFIQALLHLEDLGLLLASVYEEGTGLGSLVVFDLDARIELGTVPLPAEAVPFRLAADSGAARIWVTDTAADRLFEIDLDAVDPSLSAVTELSMPGLVADLAWQGDGTYDHLFVALASQNRLDLYDLDSGAFVDVNPVTVEVDGIRFDSPIVGLASSHDAVELDHTTSWGGVTHERVVAVATFAGDLWVAEGPTGCLARDATGPFAIASASLDEDAGSLSNPTMDDTGSTGRPVQVSPCGGVVRDEEWRVTYLESQGHWVVEGALSGLQDNVAHEDERYVSDSGAISFLIRAGTQPSTDGDQFSFETVAGLVVADGDVTQDGRRAIDLELPGRPVTYEMPDAERETGWEETLRPQHVAWPILNSDTVLKVDLSTGELDALME